MSWLTTFVRPKINAFIQKKEIPDNLWDQCTRCEQMIFHRDLVANQHVCHHCGHHMRIPLPKRFENLLDDGQFSLVPVPSVPLDPLKFKDSKRYTDRLKLARAATQQEDAVMIVEGHIHKIPVVLAAFDFGFIGGSMGMAVGEALLQGANRACALNAAYVVFPASGGARMQEGIFSLMQMPRSVIAVEKIKEAGLPYITVLTNPTMGGVAASFAMLGDIAISEPGAIIGFTGARVLQETIRQELPPGFQEADFQLAHGMIDMVVPRQELRQKLRDILSVLMPEKA